MKPDKRSQPLPSRRLAACTLLTAALTFGIAQAAIAQDNPSSVATGSAAVTQAAPEGSRRADTAQPVKAQPDTPFERFEARVTTTQNRQPHWITPLVTVTPRLEQEFRTDFVHSYNPNRTSTWNYDNGKGLELIPAERTEILINLPPFLAHSSSQPDGFGDISFLMKERLYSRNEQHGDSIVTLFFGGSVPTGKNGNGLCCAVVTPTLALGKGYRQWDVSSTLGGSLPVSNARGLGHVITWNNVVQYQVARKGIARLFWPELESNETFYAGGANDGKAVSYLTPGVVIGRIPLMPHSTSTAGQRLGLTLGAGEQIAITHFNTYNHAAILTARIPF
jgi:hypothetical protein